MTVAAPTFEISYNLNVTKIMDNINQNNFYNLVILWSQYEQKIITNFFHLARTQNVAFLQSCRLRPLVGSPV
jgi:uncharacterized protein (UPF0371 family)